MLFVMASVCVCMCVSLWQKHVKGTETKKQMELKAKDKILPFLWREKHLSLVIKTIH